MKPIWIITLVFLLLIDAGCSGGSLTTREKGTGIGALGGAAPKEPLARQWVIPGSVRQSEARWDWAPAR